MEQTEQKPKSVEELKHFPFGTFAEFKKATMEGVANVGVDRGVALQWAQNGIYSSKWLRVQALLLALLPFVAAVGFVIYAIASKSWLLLLALPVLLIAFFIFHPSSAMIFGAIRSGLIGLSFVGLVWGFLSSIPWMAALSLTLVVIWFAQRSIYRKAIDGLIRATAEHEDLLCLLWPGRALNVQFYNGNSYWSDWKTEDGQSVHYDDRK